MALGLMKRISPEYVLKNAIEDIKVSGLDGLKPYLTADAIKKLDTVQMLSTGMDMFAGMGIPFMSQPSSGNVSGASIRFMLDKMSEFEWTIKDVLKGSDSAKGVLGFKYEDNVDGTVELSMIKEDKEWRINNLNTPHFDKLELPKADKA